MDNLYNLVGIADKFKTTSDATPPPGPSAKFAAEILTDLQAKQHVKLDIPAPDPAKTGYNTQPVPN